MIYCCYKCAERYVGCHSVCKKYLKEKEIHDKIKDKILQERKTELMLDDFAVKHWKRFK